MLKTAHRALGVLDERERIQLAPLFVTAPGPEGILRG